MTAGVPGLGLGGLFALLAALCLPLLRSNSKRGSARLFGMAMSIVLAAVLAWQIVSWLYSVVSSTQATSVSTVVSSGHSAGHVQHLVRSGPAALTQPVLGHLFGVPVLVISGALLVLLLGAGELLFRVLGVRPTPLPAAIPAPEAPVQASG